MNDTIYSEPLVKPQFVRLMDVFVIGPLMIIGGGLLVPKHRIIGSALVSTGFTTIIYNALNYWKVKQAQEVQNVTT